MPACALRTALLLMSGLHPDEEIRTRWTFLTRSRAGPRGLTARGQRFAVLAPLQRLWFFGISCGATHAALRLLMSWRPRGEGQRPGGVFVTLASFRPSRGGRTGRAGSLVGDNRFRPRDSVPSHRGSCRTHPQPLAALRPSSVRLGVFFPRLGRGLPLASGEGGCLGWAFRLFPSSGSSSPGAASGRLLHARR